MSLNNDTKWKDKWGCASARHLLLWLKTPLSLKCHSTGIIYHKSTTHMIKTCRGNAGVKIISSHLPIRWIFKIPIMAEECELISWACSLNCIVGSSRVWQTKCKHGWDFLITLKHHCWSSCAGNGITSCYVMSFPQIKWAPIWKLNALFTLSNNIHLTQVNSCLVLVFVFWRKIVKVLNLKIFIQ